ncbi:DUF4212 domain-containing protein [Planctomycetota bacterium]|nr:DUF4212 domain-containing protein [Planctomycetota bacterium]MDC3251286.1 DUF4212 domain-containing protein [Planctomycetota bacterium]
MGKKSSESAHSEYWKKNLKLIAKLLFVWAFVSFGLSLAFADALHGVLFPLPGTPLGFWFAQQGSIFTFVILIWVYAWRMNRLDDEYFSEGDE